MAVDFGFEGVHLAGDFILLGAIIFKELDFSGPVIFGFERIYVAKEFERIDFLWASKMKIRSRILPRFKL